MFWNGVVGEGGVVSAAEGNPPLGAVGVVAVAVKLVEVDVELVVDRGGLGAATGNPSRGCPAYTYMS